MFLVLTSIAQNKQIYSAKFDETKKILLSDVTCGECQFKIKRNG